MSRPTESKNATIGDSFAETATWNVWAVQSVAASWQRPSRSPTRSD